MIKDWPTRLIEAILGDLVRGIQDPSRRAEFARAMGIDISQFTGMMGQGKLPGMMSQQPGFDPYMVLGLDKSASDDEVKRRYRELTFKLRPDQSGTSATTFLFQMVLAAFELIKRERGWQVLYRGGK